MRHGETRGSRNAKFLKYICYITIFDLHSRSLIQLGDDATQKLDSVPIRFQDASGLDNELILQHLLDPAVTE